MEKTTGSFLQKPRLHVLLIVFLGLLAYSNTFDAPFVFDDYLFVDYREVELRVAEAGSDVISLTDEGMGPWASRPLLYATFVLNHLLGGFDITWGYHAVNIALHLANGILLYLLVTMTGRHLGHEAKDTVPVALLSSLIFVLHPVQTEAVTMVVNRSMLMVTAFYLLGLIFFLKTVTSSGRRNRLYVLGLMVSAVLGAASREDFATFPVVLFLYDLFFISRFSARKVLVHWREYAAILPGIALMGYFAITNTYDKSTEVLGLALPPEVVMSPLQYALTQFKVHWTYLRLLVFPVNQSLLYNYPIAKSFWDISTVLFPLGYAALWAISLSFARRRSTTAFGLLWFLVALLPISFAVTLFGLRLGDPIFEHRLYLPSVGLIVLAALALWRIARERKVLVPAVAVFCLVLGGAAYARNHVWSDAGTLWRDTLKKSPNNPRVHNNLGVFLSNSRRSNEAIEHFEAAIRLWPDYGQFHANIGAVYLGKREVYKAMEHLEAAVELAPYLWYAHANLGAAYMIEGRREEALKHYLEAARLAPWNTAVLNNAAGTYYALGKKDEAVKYYFSSLWLDKKQPLVLNNLSMIFIEAGQKERAIKHLEPLVALQPDYAPARLALGRLYLDLGYPVKAIEHLRVAQSLRPNEPEIHRALSEAYSAASKKQWPGEPPQSGVAVGNRQAVPEKVETQ